MTNPPPRGLGQRIEPYAARFSRYIAPNPPWGRSLAEALAAIRSGPGPGSPGPRTPPSQFRVGSV